jgi:hypothetical protein
LRLYSAVPRVAEKTTKTNAFFLKENRKRPIPPLALPTPKITTQSLFSFFHYISFVMAKKIFNIFKQEHFWPLFFNNFGSIKEKSSLGFI